MSTKTSKDYKKRYEFYKEKCRQMGNILDSVRQQLNLISTSWPDSPTPNTSTASPTMAFEGSPTLGSCTGPTVRRHLFKTEPRELQNAHPNLKRKLEQEDISSSDDEVDFSMICGANKWECEEINESINESSNESNDPSDPLADLKKMEDERAHKIKFISDYLAKSIYSKIIEEDSA